jgi:NADH-quinone oxidoreductase subunit J
MLLTLVFSGLLFIGLGVEFLGLVYIVVYAGAIVVLFVFVLMITNQPYVEADINRQGFPGFYYTVFAFIFFLVKEVMLIPFFNVSISSLPSKVSVFDDLYSLSIVLYRFNFLLVIFTAVILFISLVSVVVVSSFCKNFFFTKRTYRRLTVFSSDEV